MVSIPYPCPVPSTGAMAKLLAESSGEPTLIDSLLCSSLFSEALLINDLLPRFVATLDPLIPFKPRLRKPPLATPLFPTLAANDEVVADLRDFVLGSAKRTNLYLEHFLASGIF